MWAFLGYKKWEGTEFNLLKIGLAKGRHFFVLDTKMVALTSCAYTVFNQLFPKAR